MTTLTRALFLAILLTSTLGFAQGTYTQIDVPGATHTNPAGINNAGDISGSYFDNNSPYQHGFFFEHGSSFIAIDYSTNGTYAYGLNDQGQVVGVTSSYPGIGFIYDVSTQTFTNVTCKGFPYVGPTAINNSGVIVGGLNPNRYGRAFELTESTCTTIEPAKNKNALAYGISSSGKLIGNFVDVPNANFSYQNGKVQRLSIPGVSNAVVTGISPDGSTLVGCSVQSAFDVTGFVLREKQVTVLEFPGAPVTCPASVNDHGVVVGIIFGAYRMTHGFLWTPDAPTEKK